MIHDSIMLTHNPYAKKKYLSRTLSNSSQEQQPNEKQQPQHEIKSRSVTGQHQPQTKTPSEPLKPSIVASPLINPYLKAKKNQTVSSLSTAKPPIPMAKPKSNFSPTVLKKKKNHRHPTKTGPPENSKPQTQNDQHSNMKPTKRPCLSTTVSNCPPSGITKLGLKLESVRPSSWNTNTAKISCEKLTLQYPNNQNLSQPKSKTLIEMPGEELLPKEISYSPRDIKPINDGYRRDLLANANVKEPLLNGWTLYPHQKQAILQALVRRRMVLALDMGLGKTLIACVWAKSFKMAFDRLKVIVICPVSLKMEWKRTAENTTALVVEDENTKSHKNPLDLQIFSWAKVPTNVDASAKHYVAVFDEAHSMQSMQSARTKDALKLVLDKRCVGVLLLSGTPMKNGKPSNLFPLLKAIRHPLGRNQMAFEKHFCAGMHKSFGRGRPVWDASGCSNLKQLKRLVSSNLLHLTKDQCLSLPPLERDRYKVPISSRNQLKYIQAVKNLASLQEASKEKEDLGEAILGGMQKLRSLCSFAKIGSAVELAKKILETQPSVVIFSCFAQVAKSIHGQLASSGWDGELLTGETPQKKRQSMVDNFQNGESAVFVCTFGAGGVGLTLTAASSIILIDRPWTPGETRQAEDRIRRIGQTKDVKSYWMSGFEIDIQIDEMIISKEEASKAVLTKEGSSVGPAAKINIQRLLRCLVAKVS